MASTNNSFDDAAVDKVLSFTNGLLRKTRPNLSKTERTVLAEDLITKAASAVLLSSSPPQSVLQPSKESLSKGPSSASTRRRSAVLIKRSTSNQAPNVPLVQKKRSVPINESSIDESKVSQFSNVFERLYATKTITSSKKMVDASSRRNSIFQGDIKVGAPHLKKKRSNLETKVVDTTSSSSSLSVDHQFGSKQSISSGMGSVGSSDVSDESKPQQTKQVPNVFQRLYNSRKSADHCHERRCSISNDGHVFTFGKKESPSCLAKAASALESFSEVETQLGSIMEDIQDIRQSLGILSLKCKK